jgi:hypothetical protein
MGKGRSEANGRDLSFVNIHLHNDWIDTAKPHE